MSSLAPIRKEIKQACVVKRDNYTIREAVEWFKKVYLVGTEVEVLAEQESQFMNNQFAKVIAKTAVDDNLPDGPLGQLVSSVAIRETLLSVAAEATA